MGCALRIELILSRIFCGHIRFKYENKFFLIKHPTLIQKYKAEQIYYDSMNDAKFSGLYDETSLKDFLSVNNLWTPEKDKDVESLKKDIETLKIGLFKNFSRTKEKELTKKGLLEAKDHLRELLSEKSSYDHLTCAGYAAASRSRYLIGINICRDDEKLIYNTGDFWKKRSKLLDDALVAYARSEIDETLYRKLARSEEWRLTWSARKTENSVFGKAACDLTENQKSLIVWSSMYDSIGESMDCPSDEIIEDDDALDGWLIIQRRERKKKSDEKSFGDLPNMAEVFIVADNKEEIQKIEQLNDNVSNSIKRERMSAVRKMGSINEEDMPDSKRQIMMQATGK